MKLKNWKTDVDSITTKLLKKGGIPLLVELQKIFNYIIVRTLEVWYNSIVVLFIIQCCKLKKNLTQKTFVGYEKAFES